MRRETRGSLARLALLSVLVVMVAWTCFVVAALAREVGSDRARVAPALRLAHAFEAQITATGQITVSFHGAGVPGCEVTSQCDVQGGLMTWSASSTPGRFYAFETGGRLATLQASLPGSVVQPAGISLTRTTAAGTQTCTVPGSGFAIEPVLSGSASRPTLALYASRRLRLAGLQPMVPPDLGYLFLDAVPSVIDPLPNHCGGPVPGDILPLLPRRVVSLAPMLRGRTTVGFAGSAPFSAGGLVGTVTSNIVLHLARVREITWRPQSAVRPSPGTVPAITVSYAIERVSGSIPVSFHSDPATCVASDDCGLAGTVTITPGPATGPAYVVAYDPSASSETPVRRAAGLSPGPISATVQSYGLALWNAGSGSVTSVVTSGAASVCSDRTPLPFGAIEIDFKGDHATVGFDGPDLSPGNFFRTRCPGPVADTLVANATLPVRALGASAVTLRLTAGASATHDGFSWTSNPDLTIVLRRTHVLEHLIPAAATET